MVNWSDQDAAQLREYLGTQSGERLIRRLEARAFMPNAITLEEEAMNSREYKGSMKIIQDILSAKNFESKPPTDGQQYYSP